MEDNLIYLDGYVKAFMKDETDALLNPDAPISNRQNIEVLYPTRVVKPFARPAKKVKSVDKKHKKKRRSMQSKSRRRNNK